MRIMKYWLDYTKSLSIIQMSGGMLYNKLITAYPKADIVYTDNIYYLATQKTMDHLLGINFFKFAKYEEGWRDCDDYSYGAMGLMRWVVPAFCFGIVHVNISTGGKHALNFFMDDKKRLYYFEPQTNKITLFAIKRSYKPYRFII